MLIFMGGFCLYTTEEAFQLCKSLGITKNIVSFRRMIRESDVKIIKPNVEKNYRLGYHISDDEMERFIGERAPGVLKLMKENAELKRKIAQLERDTE